MSISNSVDINLLEIKDVIDINLLQNFQDRFAESMGFASVIVDKNGNPVTKPSLYTSFCSDFIHSTILGDRTCAKCHRNGGEIAALTGKTYIYTCHAGLIDFAAPILIKGKLIGTILGGQVLTKLPEESKYIKVAREIGIDEYKLIESVKKVKVINNKNLEAAAEILCLIANSLSNIGYERLKLKKDSEKSESNCKNRNLILSSPEKYDKFKTDIFLTMSHELRTPLNIIFSSVQLLESIYKESLYTSQMQPFFKYSKVMKKNCYRLIRLTDNIIDMNKIKLGLFNINLRNYDIVKTVEDITMSTTDYAKLKNICISFNTEIEHVIISFDMEKFKKIMLNLLSNAIKFTQPEGNIYVNIFNQNEYILISVRDTGIGIPKNMIEMIFDAFTQVDSLLTRNTEGSGIGLSIVKFFVEMHGWKITVKSRKNEGSDFRIKVPIIALEKNLNECNEEDIFLNKLSEDTKIEFSDILT